jgi:hypothetical protein
VLGLALGAAAVGGDLPVVGEFGEPIGQLVRRDADRAGDVPGCVLLGWAYVEHGDGARFGELLELVSGDRLAAVVAVRFGPQVAWAPWRPAKTSRPALHNGCMSQRTAGGAVSP